MKNPYYDKEGNPIDLMTWAKLMEDKDYKVVKQDRVGKYLVSTVWLGLDQNLWRNSFPIIFETMIFDESLERPEDSLHMNMVRYSTMQEALEGHEEMVKLCSKI